jgi:hypothetical protein
MWIHAITKSALAQLTYGETHAAGVHLLAGENALTITPSSSLTTRWPRRTDPENGAAIARQSEVQLALELEAHGLLLRAVHPGR